MGVTYNGTAHGVIPAACRLAGRQSPRSAGGLQLISLHDLRLGPRQAIAVNRIVVNAWRS